jgi:hypothetical protein
MPMTSAREKVLASKFTGLLRPSVLSVNSVKPVKIGTTTFPLGRLSQVEDLASFDRLTTSSQPPGRLGGGLPSARRSGSGQSYQMGEEMNNVSTGKADR